MDHIEGDLDELEQEESFDELGWSAESEEVDEWTDLADDDEDSDEDEADLDEEDESDDDLEEIELEFDEDDIEAYIVDEDDNEIGFIMLDENGEEVEYYYVEEESASKAKKDEEFDFGITREGVAQTTNDINAIYRDGKAVASEFKGAFDDIKSALDFKSMLK